VSAEWIIAFEDDVEGHPLVPGTQFKIHDERGKVYSYTRTVTNREGAQWVDCYGGGTRAGSRSIRREMINPKTIFQRETLPEHLEKTPSPKPTPKKRALKKRSLGSKRAVK